MAFSYLGSDEYIMSGSGLEEIRSTVYAEKSIPQMISGHAQYRAQRAHILSAQAILSILLPGHGALDTVDVEKEHCNWDELIEEKIYVEEAYRAQK